MPITRLFFIILPTQQYNFKWVLEKISVFFWDQGEMKLHLLLFFIEETNGTMEVFAFVHLFWFYPQNKTWISNTGFEIYTKHTFPVLAISKYSEIKDKVCVLWIEHHNKVHSKYNKSIHMMSLEIVYLKIQTPSHRVYNGWHVKYFRIYKCTHIRIFGKMTTKRKSLYWVEKYVHITSCTFYLPFVLSIISPLLQKQL